MHQAGRFVPAKAFSQSTNTSPTRCRLYTLGSIHQSVQVFHMLLGTGVRNKPSGMCCPWTRVERARICNGKASQVVKLKSGKTSRVSAECGPISSCIEHEPAGKALTLQFKSIQHSSKCGGPEREPHYLGPTVPRSWVLPSLPVAGLARLSSSSSS